MLDDSLFWKPLPDLDLEVSDHGAVRTLATKRLLKPSLSSGYLRIKHNKKQYYVHVLAARAFLGPRPSNQVVRHRNGVFDDNRAANLEYVPKGSSGYSIETFLRRWTA